MPRAGRSRGVLDVYIYVHVAPRYEINLERPDLKLLPRSVSLLYAGIVIFEMTLRDRFYVLSLPSAEKTYFILVIYVRHRVPQMKHVRPRV